MIQGRDLTSTEKEKFIQKLKSTHGNVSRACKAVGISRNAAYEHRKADEEFAALWDETLDSVADEMEQEMYRRAVKGTLKPVFYKGTQIGSIREFSDSLLQFALKGKRPEIYRERVDVNQNVSGSIDLTLRDKIKKFYGKSDGQSDE